MASLGMGFVHAMLLDMADNRDSGASWNRERRLTESLVETTTRFDDLHEPAASSPPDDPPPPSPPGGGLRAIVSAAPGALNPAVPAR